MEETNQNQLSPAVHVARPARSVGPMSEDGCDPSHVESRRELVPKLQGPLLSTGEPEALAADIHLRRSSRGEKIAIASIVHRIFASLAHTRPQMRPCTTEDEVMREIGTTGAGVHSLRKTTIQLSAASDLSLVLASRQPRLLPTKLDLLPSMVVSFLPFTDSR